MNLDLLDVLKAKYGVTALRHLGNGGFGVVYSGNVFEVPRAIKMSRDVLDERWLAMTEQEFGFMKQPAIVDCPTIVQLIAVWRELGHLITVWELGEQSLAKRLAECQRQGLSGLPSEELERHLRDAASALDVLNGLGIRHRDIKPDNIVLVRGRAKITDLGLAVFVGASSLSKTASGTMGYIAPEAYGDEEQGHGRLTATVDIYALAATAIKLATGLDPFGTNPREIIKRQEAGEPHTTGLSVHQAAAVLQALRADPSERPFGTAIEFYTAFTSAPPAVQIKATHSAPPNSIDDCINTLLERARVCREQGDHSSAIACYTTVIEMDHVTVEQVAITLLNRGITHGQQNNPVGEIADYTAVIELPNAPVEWMAKAFLNRGVLRGQQNDVAGAIADYTAVIELPDVPVEALAISLRNRGTRRWEQNDAAGAIADYTAVIDLWDAPVGQKAKALFFRGCIRSEQHDSVGAIADYTAVIELPNAPVEWKAQAFLNRGNTHGQQNNPVGAIADYTAVIELPNAPVEWMAKAFLNRGITHGQQNDVAGAIADYTAVIEMESNSEIANQAWNGLGSAMYRLRETDIRTIDIAGESLDLYAVAKRIAALVPSDPASVHTAACCYAALGLWDEALEAADIFLGTDGVLHESISEADLVEFFDHFVTPETVTRALTLLDKKGFRNRVPTLIERFAAFPPGSAVQ